MLKNNIKDFILPCEFWGIYIKENVDFSDNTEIPLFIRALLLTDKFLDYNYLKAFIKIRDDIIIIKYFNCPYLYNNSQHCEMHKCVIKGYLNSTNYFVKNISNNFNNRCCKLEIVIK